jgi:hypothetical protein
MKMEQTERSEMSAYKIQTPGNYPEESIQQYFVVIIQHFLFLLPLHPGPGVKITVGRACALSELV